jgi:hypothetical protein
MQVLRVVNAANAKMELSEEPLSLFSLESSSYQLTRLTTALTQDKRLNLNIRNISPYFVRGFFCLNFRHPYKTQHNVTLLSPSNFVKKSGTTLAYI